MKVMSCRMFSLLLLSFYIRYRIGPEKIIMASYDHRISFPLGGCWVCSSTRLQRILNDWFFVHLFHGLFIVIKLVGQGLISH